MIYNDSETHNGCSLSQRERGRVRENGAFLNSRLKFFLTYLIT